MINSKKPVPRPANENLWYCLAPAPRTAIKGQAGAVGRDLNVACARQLARSHCETAFLTQNISKVG